MCSTQGTAIMTTDEYAEYLEAGALAQTDFFSYCTLNKKKNKSGVAWVPFNLRSMFLLPTQKILFNLSLINTFSLLKSTLKCEPTEPPKLLSSQGGLIWCLKQIN